MTWNLTKTATGSFRMCVVAAALTILLPACADGTGEPSSEASAAGDAQADQGASTPQDEAMDRITVSQLSPSPVSWANLWIAEPLGYYEEEGLDVEMISQQPRGANEDNLVMGLTDFTNFSNAYIIPWAHERDNSTDIKMVMADKGYAFRMLVLEDSDITSGEDLRGATIGTRSESDEATLSLFLANAGLDETEYQTVNVGGRVPAGLALEKGDVDAIIGTVVDAHFIRNADIPIRELDIGGTEGFHNSGVGTTTDMIENNRDLVVRFTRAVVKASIWQFENPEVTVELLNEVVPEAVEDAEAAQALLELNTEYSAGEYEDMFVHTPEQWQRQIDWFASAGVVESYPAEDIVNTDIMEEVLASFEVEAVKEAARAGDRP